MASGERLKTAGELRRGLRHGPGLGLGEPMREQYGELDVVDVLEPALEVLEGVLDESSGVSASYRS